jgi:hypothetical protein
LGEPALQTKFDQHRGWRAGSGIGSLVIPFLSLDHQKALGLAQYYYGSSSDRMKLAAKTLAEWGITEDQTEAQAVVSNRDSVAALNRGIFARETMRRAIPRRSPATNAELKNLDGKMGSRNPTRLWSLRQRSNLRTRTSEVQ